jgi:hypothetical protein
VRRADELTALAKTVRRSPPNAVGRRRRLYNWQCTYGGMDTDAAKELE